MKVRNGFVSNSSSSSFIVMIKKDAFEEAYETLEKDYEKELLKELYEKAKIFDFEIYIQKGYDNHGDTHLDYLNTELPDDIDAYDILYEFENKISKENIIEYTIDN